MASKISCLLVALAVSTPVLADCDVAHKTGPRNIDNYSCMFLSSRHQAQDGGDSSGNCIDAIRALAEADMLKVKACLKKAKNTEGQRAFGEYWAAWSDTLSAMRGPDIDVAKGKYDAALTQLKVFEASS